MWSGQGPASSFNCPAVSVLEFQSTGNESLIPLLWEEGGIYLLPPVPGIPWLMATFVQSLPPSSHCFPVCVYLLCLLQGHLLLDLGPT